MDENLKRLPVSTQEFTEVREDNLLYIDKTDLVWQMANAPEKVVFFSRPRRFGKTMLVSTLEAYFQGRKELFQGLKIMEMEQEWKEHPVLRFDLSGSATAHATNDSLKRQLRIYEEVYGVEHIYDTPGNRLSEVIRVAANGKRQVVCLVDEYDYPLQHTLFGQEEEHEALKDAYRDFFAVLKAQSRFIKFIFITGITKFTQLSLFSVLNNMSILSFHPEYQSVCGITTEELYGILKPYVEALATANKMTPEQAYAEIKTRYDGYHFCEDAQDIYNPYCLINALNQKKLDNYWIYSGNTQMLMNAVDKIGWDGNSFDNVAVTQQDLKINDVSKTNLAPFLYQAGYLTIKETHGDIYILGIPNTETRETIYSCIMPRLVEKQENVVNNSILGIKKSLVFNEVPSAFDYLRELVADTPYSNDKTQKAVEDRFLFIVKQTFYLCNCRILEEKQVATGRIDLVVEHQNAILVIELKMTDNGGVTAADEQINNREYTAAFTMKQKPVYTVAIEFDSKTRKMGKVICRKTRE